MPDKKPASAKGKKTTAPKKTTTPPIEQGLKKLFIDSIRDIFWAENHLTKALPKMQKAAASEELANAIGDHIAVTQKHVERLEQVFEMLGETVQAKKCDAMEGLSKEGEGIVEETEEGTAARDMGIIMASQKVEHYEIAAYSGLVHLATSLGLADVADILSQTLAEEMEADEALTEIAEHTIDYGAAGEAE